MSKRRLLVIPVLSLAIFLALGFARPALAAWQLSADSYAWSSNIGWVKMAGANYRVQINDNGHSSGFAWSSNIGWIKFNPSGGYPAAPAHGVRMNLTTGALSGWARAISPNANGESGWDGWIKMAGPNYEVHNVIDTAGRNILAGWAWGGEVVGWLRFYPPPECTTQSCPPEPPAPPCVPGTPGCGTGPNNCPDGRVCIIPPVLPCDQNGNPPGCTNPPPCNPLTDPNCTNPPPCDQNGNPPGCTNPPDYPTLGVLNSQTAIAINSQPLSSPAISSGISIGAEGGLANPLHVKVLEIRSLVPPYLSLITAGEILSGDGNQQLPKCYFKDSATPLADNLFSDCASMETLTMSGTQNSPARFHIKIHRPVQAINDNNSYQVKLGDPDVSPDASCSDEHVACFIFNYNVSTTIPV